jgi:hypothetical protein
MSQLQSFSGKICISCSKSSFILQDTKIAYSSSGTSIVCDTYVCPSCGLVIELRNIRHISSISKPEIIPTIGSPLTNLSLEQSSNQLKIPSPLSWMLYEFFNKLLKCSRLWDISSFQVSSVWLYSLILCSFAFFKNSSSVHVHCTNIKSRESFRSRFLH